MISLSILFSSFGYFYFHPFVPCCLGFGLDDFFQLLRYEDLAMSRKTGLIK
jgi:hypothetical protein